MVLSFKSAKKKKISMNNFKDVNNVLHLNWNGMK